MKAAVGVTDNRWAAFLRERPHIAEANFWVPSARNFRMLTVGDPFLFKTHWPHNRLVGGGFFSGYAVLTVQEAWDIHGEGNGVASLDELMARIANYRSQMPDPKMRIGCVLLRNLFFEDSGDGLPGPTTFAKNIVSYKGYNLLEDSELEIKFGELLRQSDIRTEPGEEPLSVDGPTRGLPRLVVPRVGQDAFKSLVLTSYGRRCAITGNRVAPVLQAAHIRPIANEGQHRVDNGLLLRSDVHILFDRGYLGLDEKHRLHVSRHLRDDYGNGDEFYSLAGRPIAVPQRKADRPHRDVVAWHMDQRFLA